MGDPCQQGSAFTASALPNKSPRGGRMEPRARLPIARLPPARASAPLRLPRGAPEPSGLQRGWAGPRGPSAARPPRSGLAALERHRRGRPLHSGKPGLARRPAPPLPPRCSRGRRAVGAARGGGSAHTHTRRHAHPLANAPCRAAAAASRGDRATERGCRRPPSVGAAVRARRWRRGVRRRTRRNSRRPAGRAAVPAASPPPRHGSQPRPRRRRGPVLLRLRLLLQVQ